MKSQRNSLNNITKSLTDQEETIQMKNQTELEISQLRLQLETEKRTSEKFNRSLSEARIQIQQSKQNNDFINAKLDKYEMVVQKLYTKLES